MRRKVMAPVTIETTRTCEEHVILTAKSDTSRNLLIRAACFDIVNKTMVVPVQELKSLIYEQTKAKETKLGSLTVDTQSGENPDTSRGLYVTRAILGQAKLVQQAKQQKKETDEAKKEINMAKMTELTLKNHNPAGDLKLVYQHLGGKVSNLPDGKRGTFIKLLLVKEEIRSIHLQANKENTQEDATMLDVTTLTMDSHIQNRKLL
jgi:hypothetical protein